VGTTAWGANALIGQASIRRRARRAVRVPRCALAPPIGVPQHPDEPRSERPVLLAVDQ
jgi:hypothetical protein